MRVRTAVAMGPGFPRLRSGPGTTPLRLPRSGDRPGAARELQDVQPGVGAIDQIDEAALVGLDVVALDRGLALVLPVHLEAARIGVRGDRRDEDRKSTRLNSSHSQI